MRRTGCMTISCANSAATGPQCPHAPAERAGFTVLEVVVSAGLSSVLLLALLFSFLMISRNGTMLFNYVGMEKDARRAVEIFGTDVRMAKAIAWTSNTDVT